MTHNWFLQIDRGGWIELQSFEITMGKPIFSVAVPLTAPSLSMLGTCASGKLISRATVSLRAGVFSGPYLQHTFADLYATSRTLSGLGDTPVKTLWFTFGKVQISYISPSNTVTWDQARLLQFHLTGSLPTP